MKLKKYRRKASSFLVEGAKNVSELLSSDFEITHLYITERFLREYSEYIPSNFEYVLCTEKELISIGTFNSNQYALAVVKMQSDDLNVENERMILMLDEVKDPGNLGTIIRIADWYGIKNIIASPGTADVYNPKVINASMGSFTRVTIHYAELSTFLNEHRKFKVYGTFLDGENIHHLKFDFPAIILLGSESSGINKTLIRWIDKKITIPGSGYAESLNVAVSTAIICDNFLRNLKN